MKFNSGRLALVVWYELIEPALEFGLPSLPLVLNDQVDEQVKEWDYPDWWYEWVELNKTVEKLGRKDKAVVASYFSTIYKQAKGRFYSWPHRGRWNWVTRRYYELLPDEMKGETNEQI